MTNKLKVNNTYLKTLLITAPFLLAATNASAGAWVAEKGAGYAKLGYAGYDADKYKGNNPTFESFKSDNVSFYGEYGLGNNFALYGSQLFQSYDQSDSKTGQNSASGLSDTELGIKYQWQANPFVFSTSFLVKAPLFYKAEDGLGNHQVDYEARALIGKSLNEYGYFGLEAGYRLRAGAPSDEYRYLVEYGFDFNKIWYFRTKLDGTLSAKNSDTPNTINSNLSNPLEFDVGKLELTTGLKLGNKAFKGYGIEFTYTREIYGENVLEGDRFELALTKVF
ncbi:hypothetical protein D5018_03385 [Parashewanella curva]|uniref:Porin n=1 Tax=Parashewanella curva TaxID=2338552 RepID=A0A3L8Q0K6_9GAMM|nr:hypothetical protein [Parashewanella curva]RLV61151.1 hypothetical protein D5018_03385 [Parashewanella curva]